jgi:hypothetical protein
MGQRLNFAIGRDLSYMFGEESLSTKLFKDAFSMLVENIHYSFSPYRIPIDVGNTFSSFKFWGRFGCCHLQNTLVNTLTIFGLSDWWLCSSI